MAYFFPIWNCIGLRKSSAVVAYNFVLLHSDARIGLIEDLDRSATTQLRAPIQHGRISDHGIASSALEIPHSVLPFSHRFVSFTQPKPRISSGDRLGRL